MDISSSVEDLSASSEAASATEEMQHQAPAASKIAEKVKEGVESVVEAATGGEDESVDEHDEL